MLDLTLRSGPFGDRYGEVPDGSTLDRLKAEPHGVYFGPNEPCLDDGADHTRRQGPPRADLHH